MVSLMQGNNAKNNHNLRAIDMGTPLSVALSFAYNVCEIHRLIEK